MNEIILTEENLSTLVSAFTAKAAYYNLSVENFLIAADSLYHEQYSSEYPDPNTILSENGVDFVIENVLKHYHEIKG